MPDAGIVFMFSGQGSQYFQMGRALYDSNATFRDGMGRLDEVARRSTGQSVIEALYSDLRRKSDPFDRTLLTHPAIFMVEYSLAQCLIHDGLRPDVVLGASLGSFAAASVAGAVDPEDALTAVVRQAIALEQCCEPGGMTAILADPGLFAQDFLSGHCELAAANFDSHFVVSAGLTELEAIEAVLKQDGIGYQRLPVAFAFHSRLIDDAKSSFASSTRSVRVEPCRLPLACCGAAAMLYELPDDYFWNAVRDRIRFRETTARLEQQGAREYIDVGPGGTLATFMKYGLPATSQSRAHAILTPFGRDEKNLTAVLAAIRH